MSNIRIVCPNCGREYTASEIFLPNSFLGKTKTVIRDEDNKIITGVVGEEMDLHEEYVCDACGKAFEVDAAVEFKTELKNKEDFEEVYVSSLD